MRNSERKKQGNIEYEEAHREREYEKRRREEEFARNVAAWRKGRRDVNLW